VNAPQKIKGEKVAAQAEGHDVLGDEFDAPAAQPAPEPRSLSRRLRGPLLVLGPVIAIIFAIAFYLHGGRFEETDNAYVQSGKVSVSSNVPGRVIAVEVHENQFVHKGDVLFRLDASNFQAEAAQARAALAAATQSVGSLRANYNEGQSNLQAAQDRLHFAQRELARQKGLLAEGIASQAQYDQAALAVTQAQQGIQSTAANNKSVLANLNGNPDLPPDQQPDVQRARAAYDRAQLNVGYTVIRAMQDGIVTKVTQLQVGNYVNAAQPLFTLVSPHIWIEANFKEDQLNYMRLGQTAKIKIDAFPSLKLTGKVSSFSPGTGNSFSVLPPENATGNWVKVVQRLPVELELDQIPADVPLHAGLSAEVTVDTQHKRHLF
jgi:membrane fusion protein, multidrug efflux system